MKLNKKGWSISEMIVFMVALIVILIIGVYLIYIIYGRYETDEASIYITLENDIAYAARDYVNDGNSNKSIITLDLLVEHRYIERSSFEDFLNDPCDGYVIHEDGEYKPYISCNKYKTAGYGKNIE